MQQRLAPFCCMRIKPIVLCAACVIMTTVVLDQDCFITTVTTVAGTNRSFPRGTQAWNAPFGALAGIAADREGNVVTSDCLKITSSFRSSRRTDPGLGSNWIVRLSLETAGYESAMAVESRLEEL